MSERRAMEDETPHSPIVENKKREMTTKEAYFASLEAWVKHANISQNAIAMFPWYLLSSYPQIFQNQATGIGVAGMGVGGISQGFGSTNQQLPNASANANVNAMPAAGLGGLRILNENLQADIIQRNGGYEYVIAPFWKRAIAEIIDVVILLLIKIMVTFLVMNIFDLELGFDLDREVLRKAIDNDDYTEFLAVSIDFLAFSSDLLLLEVLTKVIVCFYEALWTSFYQGATPGKALMKLRIKYVEAVLPLQPPAPPQLGFQVQREQMRALLFPAVTPGFGRALMRAMAKNLIMTLLFPMCFLMIFFKNNRTVYEVITKTIVVEANRNPEFRQQR